MRVYRITNDVNRYQYFLTASESDTLRLIMDGTPREGDWSPPVVFIYKPRLKKGDFLQFASGGMVITSPHATEVLRDFLEMAGELLPLPFNGEEYMLLNVTECVDCLDHAKSEWLVDEVSGQRAYPTKYAFHADRLPESPIFKIPETCMGEVLLVEGQRASDGGLIRAPEEEFSAVAQAAGLKGLVLEELWSDGR